MCGWAPHFGAPRLPRKVGGSRCVGRAADSMAFTKLANALADCFVCSAQSCKIVTSTIIHLCAHQQLTRTEFRHGAVKAHCPLFVLLFFCCDMFYNHYHPCCVYVAHILHKLRLKYALVVRRPDTTGYMGNGWTVTIRHTTSSGQRCGR